MSAKHTPGPWYATPLRQVSCLFDIGAENGANVAEVYTEKNGGQPEAEAQANARLIAAAPDLLAALMGIVMMVDGFAVSETALSHEIEAARKAIAKAEGRS